MSVIFTFLRVSGVVSLTFLLLLPQSVAGPAEEGNRIVFLSNREGVGRSFDLFLLELSTRAVRNVTADFPGLGLTSASAPRLLRKRNSIVCFASGGKSLVEIPLGKGPVRLLAKITQAPGQLAVSPNGQSLLYSDRVGDVLQILETDVEREATRNLSSNSWNESEPAYSRDGQSITYVTDRDGSLSIALMARDGSGQKILTNNFGDDRYPRFSPGGDRVVFSSSRSGRNDSQYDLYMVDTSGGHFEMLHSNGGYNTFPSFSPDGKDIIFVSTNFTTKVSHVLLFNRASCSVTDLTLPLPLFSQSASFSDDGHVIVFEQNTVRDCEVMLYDRKTGLLENLTQNPAWDCSPSF